MLSQKDPARLEARAKELQQIVSADQKDRMNWEEKTPEQMMEMQVNDQARRKRVGEIFGEGCFYIATISLLMRKSIPTVNF